jgi:hypothetical protein
MVIISILTGEIRSTMDLDILHSGILSGTRTITIAPTIRTGIIITHGIPGTADMADITGLITGDLTVSTDTILTSIAVSIHLIQYTQEIQNIIQRPFRGGGHTVHFPETM